MWLKQQTVQRLYLTVISSFLPISSFLATDNVHGHLLFRLLLQLLRVIEMWSKHRNVTIYRCNYTCMTTRTCMYIWPYVHPLYIYALSYQTKVSIAGMLQLFHWLSSLKCESLASGVGCTSAILVSAALFYSPDLRIGYDGVFRLREANDSLDSTIDIWEGAMQKSRTVWQRKDTEPQRLVFISFSTKEEMFKDNITPICCTFRASLQLTFPQKGTSS